MDPLTHALSGALLARATVPDGRSIPRYVAAGLLACAAPDLDFLWTRSPLEYLVQHRGITHSLVLLPLWALGLAWLLAKIVREPLGWRALYGISAGAIALHILGDLITSYGTTFIIDLWLSGILVAGLVVSCFTRSRKAAIGALALVLAYVGFQYALKQQALDFARAHARQFGMNEVQVHPRPVSPFNWTVFASDGEKHDMANVNLVRRSPKSWHPGDGFIARLDAPYLPVGAAVWVTRYRYGTTDAPRARDAWNSSALSAFRWFAAVPAFDVREGECYYFVDLRFATPGREPTPFRFGACEGRSGWRLPENARR